MSYVDDVITDAVWHHVRDISYMLPDMDGEQRSRWAQQMSDTIASDVVESLKQRGFVNG